MKFASGSGGGGAGGPGQLGSVIANEVNSAVLSTNLSMLWICQRVVPVVRVLCRI
jgi:hypothetical protein